MSVARHIQQLGASERFFVKLRRFTPINVTRVVALAGVLDPADLEPALAALQARHPLLRARIVDTGAASFEHDAALPLRLQLVQRESDQHFLRVLERVLNTELARSTGSSFAVYYVYAKEAQRAELIVAGEHAACDGVSMNQLCAELLQLAARAAPVEVKPALPVLEDMLPTFPLGHRLHSFGASLLTLARLSLARWRYEQAASARSTAFDFVTLTRRESEALVQRARAQRTTVTGALMAALLHSLRALRPDIPELSLSVPINLRPRLPGHTLGPEDLGNYTSAAYLSSAARGDLWSLARALKADLDAQATRDRLLAAAPLVYRAGRLFVRRGARPLAHAMLSNSGHVSLLRDYGAFRPVAFYSASSAPMLSADLSLFCNTFDGQLTINLLFSEQIMSRALAAQIGARLRALLTEASAAEPGFVTAA